MDAPYYTVLYKNLFLLRVSISFGESPVTLERQGGRELLKWEPHNVSLAESCAA